jgi:ABC-type Fe3+-hydroxamate transport system substrate-binding protein
MTPERREEVLKRLPEHDRRRIADLIAQYKRAKSLEFQWHARQKACNEAIESKRAEIAARTGGIGGVPTVLYGGGLGGGKSFYACAKVVTTCEAIPGMRFFMCRNEAKAFTNTTLDTMLRQIGILSRPGWKQNKHEMKFTHPNGSIIQYGGLGSAEDAERVKSMELDGAVIEEGSDTEEAAARLLIGRPGRSERSLRHGFVLITSNPEDCWLQRIVDSPGPDEVFVQSLLKDNTFLPDGYRERIEGLYEDTPELLDAYVNGVWGMVGSADKVFDPLMLRKCVGAPGVDGLHIWGVDVARFGDDSTVLYRVRGTRVVELRKWDRKSTREVADDLEAVYMAAEDSPDFINIDDIGVGGGVVDNLVSAGLPVVGINAGGQAAEPHKFFNRRAEIYWNLKLLVDRQQLSIPADDELLSELRAVKYLVRNGKIVLEAKAEVKKRLGRSPDKADALALALAPVKAPRRIAGPVRKPRGW